METPPEPPPSTDPPQDGPSQPRRFQTRRGIQRTSKADREAFARAEAERVAHAQRETERLAAAAARGTYIPRGRGAAALLNNSAERIRNENSGGVFGAAVPGLPGTRGRGRGRGRGGATFGEEVKEESDIAGAPAAAAGEQNAEKKATTRKKAAAVEDVDDEKKPAKTKAKSAAEERRKTAAAKKAELDIVSSDDEGVVEEGPRRDIETIEISSDEELGEDEDDNNEGPLSTIAKGKRSQRSLRPPRAKMALRPVRASRDAREVNEFDGFSARKKVQRSVKERDKTYVATGEDEFDGVPVDDADEMDVDEGGQGPSAQDELDFSLAGIEARSKNKKKGPPVKDTKVASETIEERAERLRYAEDVRKIRHELSAMAPVMAPTGEDVDMTEPERLDYAAAKGQTYLFQFPPLTPMLVDPALRDETGPTDESTADGTTAIPTPVAGNKGKEKEKPPHIKKEDEEKNEIKAAAATERSKVLMADGARLPSGMAGKLNVHKSGKVTLEWGGTNLEVRWGSEVDFLQDVVLAGADDEVGVDGTKNAYALGQVQKKMVVIPDWQKIYE